MLWDWTLAGEPPSFLALGFPWCYCLTCSCLYFDVHRDPCKAFKQHRGYLIKGKPVMPCQKGYAAREQWENEQKNISCNENGEDLLWLFMYMLAFHKVCGCWTHGKNPTPVWSTKMKSWISWVQLPNVLGANNGSFSNCYEVLLQKHHQWTRCEAGVGCFLPNKWICLEAALEL